MQRCKTEETSDKLRCLAGEFESLSTADIGAGTDLQIGADISVTLAPDARGTQGVSHGAKIVEEESEEEFDGSPPTQSMPPWRCVA